ncbi:hypothetical protein UFOVP230_75 [uncultured Caudovirales phage]|uniref:Uncharacterized protein n=1 Tax=uncultured Caudovirales phage TaxID=2100421 RepID=A0A6J7XWT9_9CAUD|nr:hypothetical protein UFOVP230_75 [uncultured Caudovirales phage]
MSGTPSNTFTSPAHSVTVQGAYEPFDLQTARAQVMGHSTVNIYGFQVSVTTTNIPIWEVAGAYAYPAAATAMNLASSVNTGADKTGTTVLISGLDSTYAPISETLTLNGTTVVVTTKSYLRINNISVSSVTGGVNPTGTITLKDLTNTTTYAQINPSIGRSQMAIYTVPAGYTFYLSRIDAYTSANGSSADWIQYRNVNTTSSGVTTLTQQAPFTNTYHSQRVMPRPFAEKTDIQLQAKTSANTYAVSIAAEGYLIKNDLQAE